MELWLALILGAAIERASAAEVAETLQAKTVKTELFVSREKFCQNPASHLCAAHINPLSVDVRSARFELDRINNAGETDAQVQELIKSKSEGNGRNCSDLSNEEFVECKRVLATVVGPKVFTETRKEKANQLFERARKTILVYLTNQQSRTVNSQDRVALGRMIDDVKKTHLYFGAFNSPEVKFNAQQIKRMREGDIQWFHRQDGIDTASSVYLDGAIMLADKAPETLYLVLLHEISHGIGPRYFRGDRGYPDNPFREVFRCLRRQESVGVKSADANCIAIAARLTTDEKRAADLRELEEKIRLNPDHADPGPPDVDCARAQLNEAWSDWLPAEAYAQEKLDQLKSVQANSGWHLDLGKRLAAFPELSGYLSFFCMGHKGGEAVDEGREGNKHAHPTDMDRINGLLLTSPAINEALGCKTVRPKDLTTSSTGGGTPVRRMYCGREEPEAVPLPRAKPPGLRDKKTQPGGKKKSSSP